MSITHACDCATGEVAILDMTDAEKAAHDAAQADAARVEGAIAAERDALREAVAGHPDPVVRALAARLGIA